MANFGTKREYFTDYNALEFYWRVSSVSVSTNATTIYYELRLISESYGAIESSVPKAYGITINSTTINSGQNMVNISNNSTKVLASGYHTILHNMKGDASFSYRAVQYFDITFAGESINYVAVVGTVELPNIARAVTITGVPDVFTDEDTPTLSYNNPFGNSITSLQACISFDMIEQNIPYREISKVGSYYIFNFTEEEREILRKGTTDRKTRAVYFYIRIVKDGEISFVHADSTLEITNATPTVSATFYDGNAKTYSLTKNRKAFVRGYSNLTYSLSATAYKHAEIVEYTAGVKDQAATTREGSFNAVNSDYFRATATDTRGYVGLVNYTLDVINYITPTCVIDAADSMVVGELKFNINGNYFNDKFGAYGDSNSLAVIYRYCIKGEDITAAEWKYTTNIKIKDNTYSVDVTVTIPEENEGKVYIIEAVAQDKLVAVTSEQVTITTRPIFDWSKNDFNFNVPVTVMGTQILSTNILSDTTTNGTVTLTDKISNYEYIEIYYTDNNGRGRGITRIDDIGSSAITVDLSLIEASSATGTYIRRTAYICNGNTLTPNTQTAGYVWLNGTSISHLAGTNFIKITKVLGYK